MKVKVYYNLQKKTFSVMSLEKDTYGIVVGYSDRLYLKDVTFKVSEAGRQRVLKEQQKNVHAFVEGTIVDLTEVDSVVQSFADGTRPATQVFYNPYLYDSFVTKTLDFTRSIKTAKLAALNNKTIFVIER